MLYIFPILIFILSVIIHEVSHGYAAYVQGDNTAKFAGRLTLNPIPHIDLFGSGSIVAKNIDNPDCYIIFSSSFDPEI